MSPQEIDGLPLQSCGAQDPTRAASEAEITAAFERRIELTQLRAGHVLTEDDATAITELMDELEEVEATACDAYADGEKRGREEAGGLTIAGLMEQRDHLRLELSVQKALVKFAYADRDALRSRQPAPDLLEALEAAYTFITQPQAMHTPAGGPNTATYRVEGYNALTAKLRAAIANSTTPTSGEAQ